MGSSADIVAYAGDAENLRPPCAARSVVWDGTYRPHEFTETVGFAAG